MLSRKSLTAVAVLPLLLTLPVLTHRLSGGGDEMAALVVAPTPVATGGAAPVGKLIVASAESGAQTAPPTTQGAGNAGAPPNSLFASGAQPVVNTN